VAAVVTFEVDDVVPAAGPLTTRPLGDLYDDAIVVGGDPALPVVPHHGVHPLLSAVGLAFNDHRPLVLTPDAVWLTIAQGVAQHVRLNAEALRHRLVRHTGRKKLVLDLATLPTKAAGWAGAVESVGKLLAAKVDDADLFECDFSTSTPVDRTAARVVLLDAYSPYFSVWLMGVCGIPSVTLTGTVDDWRRIRERVGVLGERFGLETWCRSLAPIADQFVRAAAGEPDVAFWKRIYNPADAYGGQLITGWATRFYPYLEGDGGQDRPNPMLDLPLDEPRDLTVGPDDHMGYTGPGITSDTVPATLSRVRVNLVDLARGENSTVTLHGGVAAVAQDPDGALRPVTGWHVAAAAVEIDDVIERIVAEHHADPPVPSRFPNGPAEMLAIYRRMGSATLFDGAWRLLPDRETRHAGFPRGPSMTAYIDLPDGRSIAEVSEYSTGTSYWVVCRIEAGGPPPGPDEYRLPPPDRLVDRRPEDVPVYGTSLALLLETALDHGGDFEQLRVGTLDRFGPRE
jgi:hypothetical protein